MEELDHDTWSVLEREHHRRVDELTAGHLARRSRGEKHPVEDFLWVYYSYRPGQLRRWHPGPEILLRGDDDPRGRQSWRFYTAHRDGSLLDVAAFMAHRGDRLRQALRLLEATAARTPSYSCFGLHEWAMVYRLPASARRHEQLPLRLAPADVDEIVESRTLRCSHYDAYRFFTPDAVPRNALPLTAAGRVDQEQPGCLHATMDLYRWAFVLSPAVPSELVLRCLDLACQARTLDMAASPYDVRAFGIEPIAVETTQGRARYVEEQQRIAHRGQELRAELAASLTRLLTADRTPV